MNNRLTKTTHTYIQRGVWTPWAHVLCLPCHGNNFPNRTFTEEEWEQEIKPQPRDETYGVTTCQTCGCAIQLDDSVAGEREILKKLREAGIEAHMWQTGGMCSAVGIPMKQQREGEDEYYIMVTYNFNGDKEYMVGVYEEEGEFNDEKSFCSFSEEEVMMKLLAQKELFCKWTDDK